MKYFIHWEIYTHTSYLNHLKDTTKTCILQIKRKLLPEQLMTSPYLFLFHSFVSLICVLLFYARTPITVSNKSDDSRIFVLFLFKKECFKYFTINYVYFIGFSVDSFYH